MTTVPEMEIEPVEVRDPITRARTMMYVAHGPGGFRWLLKRCTPEAAQRDGLAYFLAGHVMHNGAWYIADEHGRPFADCNGDRVPDGMARS